MSASTAADRRRWTGLLFSVGLLPEKAVRNPPGDILPISSAEREKFIADRGQKAVVVATALAPNL
jgi:hypothetical protein